jgi:hypothetical protein
LAYPFGSPSLAPQPASGTNTTATWVSGTTRDV